MTDTTADRLVAFIAARLDEAETNARHAVASYEMAPWEFVLADVRYGRWLLADHAERRSIQSLAGLLRYTVRFDQHEGYDEAWRPA